MYRKLLSVDERLKGMLGSAEGGQNTNHAHVSVSEFKRSGSRLRSVFTATLSDADCRDLVTVHTCITDPPKRTFSSKSDFVAHLQTVAKSRWGGWLFECRNREGFMKKWKESSARIKQDVVNSMLEELVPELSGSLRLFNFMENMSVDTYGFYSEINKSFVVISFEKSFFEMRVRMVRVREDVPAAIKTMYDKCLATEFYAAHVIEPDHLALVVDACTSGGQFSFRGGSMDIVLGILNSILLANLVQVYSVSDSERRLHTAGTMPLGKEKEICAFSPKSGDEKWGFVNLNSVTHDIEINGNHAAMGARQLEFYRVETSGVVEYLTGHETYTDLYVGPLYFSSSYNEHDLLIRVWPYETTFYGGGIDKTNIHFHVSIRLL